MRENRTYGSEGGEGQTPSRPLSATVRRDFFPVCADVCWRY